MRSLRPLGEYRRVVVRLPNALGDTVMATPALTRLADAIGPERIGVVGRASSLALLSGGRWFDREHPFDPRGRHRGLRGLQRIAREVRDARYDLAILFPNSFGSALQMFAARVPHRLGYFKEGRRMLLTAGRPRRRDAAGTFEPIYTGRYFTELLDLIPELPSVELAPRLHVDETGEQEFERWSAQVGWDQAAPLIIVVPGAAYGPSKIWLPERYAAVVDGLVAQRPGAAVMISAGPGEEPIADAVREAMRAPALPAAPLSLHAMKSVFSRASFVLTNDTGPRHLAVAFDVPAVTIMGPTDPRYTELASERGEVVRHAVDCMPCQRKVCPLPEQVCMTGLTSERVLERCLAAWPEGD